MAKTKSNSVTGLIFRAFAVLIVVAGAVLAVSLIKDDDELRPLAYASGGAMVFLVILYFILKSRVRKYKFRNLTGVDQMEGHVFEEWCAQYLKRHGFKKVEVTSGSGDNGVDILAKKDGLLYGFQCKRMNGHVPNKAVQEIYTGMKMYECDRGVVITNSYFSKSAEITAERCDIELWDRDTLLKG